MNNIIDEMNDMFLTLDEAEVNAYVIKIRNHINDYGNDFNFIGLGAGRMGYSLRSFIMRLSHMGFQASMIGDTNVPRVTKSSILIVNSSSGETPSILNYSHQAVEAGGQVFLTCCNKNSSIAKCSTSLITIPKINSKQLMKSPYEQFSMLLYDYLVMKLMDVLNLDADTVSHNHSILE